MARIGLERQLSISRQLLSMSAEPGLGGLVSSFPGGGIVCQRLVYLPHPSFHPSLQHTQLQVE